MGWNGRGRRGGKLRDGETGKAKKEWRRDAIPRWMDGLVGWIDANGVKRMILATCRFVALRVVVSMLMLQMDGWLDGWMDGILLLVSSPSPAIPPTRKAVVWPGREPPLTPARRCSLLTFAKVIDPSSPRNSKTNRTSPAYGLQPPGSRRQAVC